MRFSLFAIIALTLVGPETARAGTLVGVGQAAPAPTVLRGSREEQVARLLAAMIQVGASREWAIAQAAFPGARWEARTSDTAPTRIEDGITYPSQLETLGYTDLLDGSIDLNGERFRITITGTVERVTGVRLQAPENVRVERAALRRAFDAQGVGWRLLRCNPIGETIVEQILELTAGGRSAIFQDSFSGEASAYSYAFDGGLYDSADPPGECAEGELRAPQ